MTNSRHFVVVNLETKESTPIECQHLRYLDSGWVIFYNEDNLTDEVILGLPSVGFLFYAVSPEEYNKIISEF